MFPFKFKLSGDNSGVFWPKRRLCYVRVFGLLWATVAPFVRSSLGSEVTKKILINSGFVRFRRNFSTIKLDF